MNVQQLSLSQSRWKNELVSRNIEANLFLFFGSPEFNDRQALLDSLHIQYPKATLRDGFSPCELHNQAMTITTLSEC